MRDAAVREALFAHGDKKVKWREFLVPLKMEANLC